MASMEADKTVREYRRTDEVLLRNLQRDIAELKQRYGHLEESDGQRA